jgi:hypothetical protein
MVADMEREDISLKVIIQYTKGSFNLANFQDMEDRLNQMEATTLVSGINL